MYRTFSFTETRVKSGQTKKITSYLQPLNLDKALLWFCFCCCGFWLFCFGLFSLNNVFMQLITAIFGTWHGSLFCVLWYLYLFLHPGLTCQFSVVLHCWQNTGTKVTKGAILLALQMRELVIDMVCFIAECRRTLHLSFHPVAFHFSQRGLDRCKTCICLEQSHSRHTLTQYDFRYFMK